MRFRSALRLSLSTQHSALSTPFLRGAEWLLLALAAPFLLFPGRYVLVGAGLVALGWLVRRLATGRWAAPTTATRWVLLLLAMLGVSLLVSPRIEYSVPKFWGLVLGLATFYAVLDAARTPRTSSLVAAGLVLAGVAAAVLGLVGMMPPPEKILDDRGIYAALPRLLTAVQSSTIVTQGIHPNELAGLLTLVVPLAAALAFQPRWTRWLAASAALFLFATLVYTQSRAGLLGVLAALAVGAVWRGGRPAAVVVALTLAVAAQAAFTTVGPERLQELALGDAPTAGAESLIGRVELWQRGLAMLVDTPFTGVGLNAFPVVLRDFYPTLLHSAETLVPHAHDLYLQTALDLGLPGLLAFLAIATLATRSGLQSLTPQPSTPTSSSSALSPQPSALRSQHSALVVGLLLGLLAHAVYGLVDAVTLGAKPGPLLWAMLALLLAPSRSSPAPSPSLGAPSPSGRGRGVRAGPRLLLLLLLPATLAPAALNLATALLHRPAPPLAVVQPAVTIAAATAWGPFASRAWNAQSLLARAQDDPAAELQALAAAAPAAPWDPTLALRLADLRLARGDRPGAVDAWRIAHLVEPPLARGRQAASPAETLDWYALAQAVDPADWRPYAATATRLLQSGQPNQAALMLAEALRLRGDRPARAATSARLVSPAAPLPRDAQSPPSRTDATLFLTAARIFEARGDLAGAAFASQLAHGASGITAPADLGARPPVSAPGSAR